MNNESKNMIFDIAMTEALKEYMDTELKIVDELVQAEPCEFSDKFKKRVHKIGNSIGRTDRMKLFAKIVFKTAVSVAAAFGIVFGMLLKQPDVYAAVQKTIRTVFGEYDKIEYVDNSSDVIYLDDSIRLGYVPEGYYLSKGKYTPIDVVLTYTNNIDNIRFEYGIADGTTVCIDNEHCEHEQFISHGIEYHYYNSFDTEFDNTLIWSENGYYFMVSAYLTKDVLVKIAENLYY